MEQLIAYSGLINAVTSIALGCFVLFSKWGSPVAIRFVLFSFGVGYWAFNYFLWLVASDASQALYFIRQAMVGALFIPPVFVSFVLRYLNRKTLVADSINFLLCIVFLSFAFSDNFITTVEARQGFRFWPVAGPLFHPMLLFFAANAVASHSLLWNAIVNSKGVNRLQHIYIFFGTFVGFLGGSTNYFLWYNIPIPPVLNIFVSLYIVSVTYAILKHRLLDIEIIVKKTLVFTGLFAFVMAIVSTASLVTQDLLNRVVSIPPFFSTVIAILLAISFYDPVRKVLLSATDKFLFQKKEDFKVVLNRLSQDIITILDLKDLARKILSTLQATVRIESAVLLLRNEDEDDSFSLLDSFGVPDAQKVFERSRPILRRLSEAGAIINLEGPSQDQITDQIRAEMERFRAVVALPLIIKSGLIGVLFMGPKRSDQEYTKDEIEYFPTLMSQIAIALSNGRLYDTLKKSQIDFAQQAKMAAIGTLSAGISHEIKNPLNHIKVGISMLRMNKKHGIFEKMQRYQFEEEVFKTLDILDENVGRANEVIERLSSFAKKPKELKIEPADLRKAVDSSLAFVDHDFKSFNVIVEKHFDDNFPLVRCDLHTMEDIFLNLFVNARHAMPDYGTLIIKGLVHEDEVEVLISDTGKGISKENLVKIWDPFFTTKDVSRNPDQSAIKGSGLGLFIVREFIQRFGGRITVESQVDKGTAFHIYFPKSICVKPEEGLMST